MWPAPAFRIYNSKWSWLLWTRRYSGTTSTHFWYPAFSIQRKLTLCAVTRISRDRIAGEDAKHTSTLRHMRAMSITRVRYTGSYGGGVTAGESLWLMEMARLQCLYGTERWESVGDHTGRSAGRGPQGQDVTGGFKEHSRGGRFNRTCSTPPLGGIHSPGCDPAISAARTPKNALSRLVRGCPRMSMSTRAST